MALSPQSHSLVFIAFVFLRLVSPSFSKTEAEILLKFKASLKNATVLSTWDPAARPVPCAAGRPNWYGVLCAGDKVFGLNLNAKGLAGSIDVDSLVELPALRVFGVMDNNFEGPLPPFKKLGSLKFLYLSHNKFSGDIPDDAFAGMQSLKKVHLAYNEFSGAIPTSLAMSKRLIELMLEDNKFYGKLPDFGQERLTMANFSNNNLEGQIPAMLSNLKPSSFSGNVGLCGKPLEPCAAEGSTKPNTPVKTIIIAAVGAVLAVVLAIAVFFVMCKKKPREDLQDGSTRAQVGAQTTPTSAAEMDKMEQGSQVAARTPDHAAGAAKKSSDPQTVKLSFLRDNVPKFDLPDLLKAQAQILGNGVFGSTYKAALVSGPVVVVKRFRHMNNVGKEDFVEHMRRLGRLSHKNLLPILAFYYRKEEKLLVFDHVEKSSLASHLHGNKNKSRSRKDLDWPTRLKIVKGVARGMLYLYNELPSMTVANGHLKSSNVLLDSSYEPLIGDYGLLPIVNQDHAEEHMVAYKSPDFRQGGAGGGRLGKKTDVWTLGILILETLTGKSAPDVETLVQSVGPTMEVVDEDMEGITKSSEGEIVKLLQVVLKCCEADVEKRWEMKEAVERIEEVRERDGEDDFYSSYTSDDVRSSRGLSEDFNQVSLNNV